MTTHKDTDLREALRRRYANTPQLPEDFADRLMQRIDEKGKKPKRRILWLYPAIAVAASMLLLVTLHYYNDNAEPQDVVAQTSDAQPQTGMAQAQASNAQPLPSPQGEGQGVGSVNKTAKPSKKILTPPLTPPLHGRGAAAHHNSQADHNISQTAQYNSQADHTISQATHPISQATSHSDSIEKEKQEGQMDENLHYATNITTEKDTVPYQAPSRVDEFIAKLAEYNKVKEAELTCSATLDSSIVSKVYVFPDKQEIDLFGRLLQIACWYSDETPGYFMSYSHQQFFFELKDVRKQLQYRWIAERINGKILLYSTCSPVGVTVSSACYQEYCDELRHTKIIHTKTLDI